MSEPSRLTVAEVMAVLTELHVSSVPLNTHGPVQLIFEERRSSEREENRNE